MQLSFAKIFDIYVKIIDDNTQKIDYSRLEIFGLVITFVVVDNKDKKFRFFEEVFLLANINIGITFKIFFLILSNIKIEFNNREFWWKLYITIVVFLTTR